MYEGVNEDGERVQEWMFIDRGECSELLIDNTNCVDNGR